MYQHFLRFPDESDFSTPFLEQTANHISPLSSGAYYITSSRFWAKLIVNYLEFYPKQPFKCDFWAKLFANWLVAKLHRLDEHLGGRLRHRRFRQRRRPPLVQSATRRPHQLSGPRSWHHCQQLGDLPRVAGGVGSDATAEAVDGRAKAVQLSVVDNEESIV